MGSLGSTTIECGLLGGRAACRAGFWSEREHGNPLQVAGTLQTGTSRLLGPQNWKPALVAMPTETMAP